MNIFTRMQLNKEFKELSEILEVYWKRVYNYSRNNFPKRTFCNLTKQEKDKVMKYVNKHIIGSKLSSRDWFLANCQWETDNYLTEIIFCEQEAITEFSKMDEEFCSKFNRFIEVCNELSINLKCTKWDGVQSLHNSVIKELRTSIIIINQ